jgi:hypothetical protein
MAKPETLSEFSTAAMLKTLQYRPLCDSSSVDDLTSSQQAALHVFQYEVLAAFYRVQMVVPLEKVIDVLDKKFNHKRGGRSGSSE